MKFEVVPIILAVSFFVAQAQAQTFRVLYSFKGTPDGAQPYGSLILDTAGNLYGTTSVGGVSGASVKTCAHSIPQGCGTVFKIDPDGNETVLYRFLGGADGSQPNAALVADSSGNLYGTTAFGGIYDDGTIFKLDSNGTETILHTFSGLPDGELPLGPLILDANNNLYGTTSEGGADGQGTVFEITPTGEETILHSFHARVDGRSPDGGLIRDKAGNFYGYTFLGGSVESGVVFKLDKDGNEIGLFNFLGGKWGSFPEFGSLVADGAGNVYGTTVRGGKESGCNCGVVYKLDAAGNETPLYIFVGSNGEAPESGLIRDAAGNLYGTTSGANTGNGTVFKVESAGNGTVLYRFSGGTDGKFPEASLIMDQNGNLYGTTSQGGEFGQGVVFEVSP